MSLELEELRIAWAECNRQRNELLLKHKQAAIKQQEKPNLNALYEVVGEIVQTGTCINLTKLHDYLGGEQIDVRSIISDEPQEKPEPVAKVELTPQGPRLYVCGVYVCSFIDAERIAKQINLGFKSPPRREWVNITVDEFPNERVKDRSFLEGAQWAEAKAKELNT